MTKAKAQMQNADIIEYLLGSWGKTQIKKRMLCDLTLLCLCVESRLNRDR
jgi:hypothetical protein